MKSFLKYLTEADNMTKASSKLKTGASAVGSGIASGLKGAASSIGSVVSVGGKSVGSMVGELSSALSSMRKLGPAASLDALKKAKAKKVNELNELIKKNLELKKIYTDLPSGEEKTAKATALKLALLKETNIRKEIALIDSDIKNVEDKLKEIEDPSYRKEYDIEIMNNEQFKELNDKLKEMEKDVDLQGLASKVEQHAKEWFIEDEKLKNLSVTNDDPTEEEKLLKAYDAQSILVKQKKLEYFKALGELTKLEKGDEKVKYSPEFESTFRDEIESFDKNKNPKLFIDKFNKIISKIKTLKTRAKTQLAGVNIDNLDSKALSDIRKIIGPIIALEKSLDTMHDEVTQFLKYAITDKEFETFKDDLDVAIEDVGTSEDFIYAMNNFKKSVDEYKRLKASYKGRETNKQKKALDKDYNALVLDKNKIIENYIKDLTS